MPTFTPNERHTLALTGAGHFSTHFSMLVYPTVAVVLARTEGLPFEKVIGWSFLGYLLYGLGALPVGLLTDHAPARWAVRIGVLGLGASMIAVSLVDPGPAIALTLGIAGAFASIYHPAGMGLISRTIEHRGTGLGINGIFGSAGIASAPILAEFTANLWGWRGAYLSLGALLLALGMAVVFLKIEEPSPGASTKEERHHQPADRMKLFGILMIVMTLGGLSYRAATVAQPAYFAERVTFMGYGAATSLAYILGSVGQLIAGRLADRYDLRWLYLGFHMLSLPFLYAMVAFAGAPLVAAASGYIFFSIGMQPIENSLVAKFTPDRWRSTGYGLKFIVTFGVGALSVRGVEVLIARYSLSYVFLAISGVVLLMLITITGLLWRTRGRAVYNRVTA